mmetsp:Transcript_12643/g.29349  ORF Transcript_12643/g.29349 Transcript_12643/m.29349 type:complete len:215 (+) Transcript_12643:228-872(+)
MWCPQHFCQSYLGSFSLMWEEAIGPIHWYVFVPVTENTRNSFVPLTHLANGPCTGGASTTWCRGQHFDLHHDGPVADRPCHFLFRAFLVSSGILNEPLFHRHLLFVTLDDGSFAGFECRTCSGPHCLLDDRISNVLFGIPCNYVLLVHDKYRRIRFVGCHGVRHQVGIGAVYPCGGAPVLLFGCLYCHQSDSHLGSMGPIHNVAQVRCGPCIHL